MIEIKKHFYNIGNNNINIMMFGDLHYDTNFSNKKLTKIANKIDSNTDYLFISGDLIDNTNIKTDRLITFLNTISNKCQIFITLGNHDIVKIKGKKHIKDDKNKIWKELSKINNIFISRDNNYYEDDKIIVYMIELNYNYYYNDNKEENKEILLNKLKKDKKYLNNMNNNKVKIAVCHSPIHISDKEITKELNNFDFIFSGHTHNGMVPYFSDKLIKNNKGIISPYGKLFPNTVRGIKDLDNTHLIINGGITKLSKSSGIIKYFNFIYPSSIDNIIINKIKKGWYF